MIVSFVFPFILLFVTFVQEPWAESLNPSQGITYFNVAEELAAKNNLSENEITLITELYVFAAVSDPFYRDSSIAGIIAVLKDEELSLQLKNLKSIPNLLVPSVVQQQQQLNSVNQAAIEELCMTITTIRQGKAISSERAKSMKPWSYMFPNSFDSLFQGTQKRRKTLSPSEIEVTLKVELSVLGGSSLWSADFAATSGQPVTISMSDDLASLLSVDPTKRIRKNGRWVSK